MAFAELDAVAKLHSIREARCRSRNSMAFAKLHGFRETPWHLRNSMPFAKLHAAFCDARSSISPLRSSMLFAKLDIAFTELNAVREARYRLHGAQYCSRSSISPSWSSMLLPKLDAIFVCPLPPLYDARCRSRCSMTFTMLDTAMLDVVRDTGCRL
jgi:hypothetical protein